MSAVKKTVDKRLLKALVPINALAPQHFNEIADKIILEDLPAGRVIFKEGERDNRTVYLLAGEITLFSGATQTGSVYGDTESARHPLSPPLPRQVTAKAKTPVTIARIDTGLLDVLLTWDQSSGYEVTELEDGDEDWMSRMLQSPTFQKLPAANIQKLLMSIEEYPAAIGSVVIKQGDPGDYYYIIKQGHCVVTRKASPAAQDVKLAELSVGDSFGEDALISDSKRNATITMLTDGLLMRLAKKDFVALLREPLLAQVSFAKAQNLVSEGAHWLDVRLPGEFQQDHIIGAMNIPLAALRHQFDDLDAASRYIVYCDNGGRSSTAAFLLSQHGYDVHVLIGGTQALAPSEMRAVHGLEKSAARSEALPSGSDGAEVIDFNQQAQARKTADEGAGAQKEARHAAEELLAEARRQSEQLLREAEQQAGQVQAAAAALLAEARTAQTRIVQDTKQQSAKQSMLAAERDAAIQKVDELEEVHNQLTAQHAQLQQALQAEIDRAQKLAATPATTDPALVELRRELKAAQRDARTAEQARQTLAQELSSTLSNLQQLEHAAQDQSAAEQNAALQEELDALREQLNVAQRDVAQAQQSAQEQLAVRDEKIATMKSRIESARQQVLDADHQKTDLEAASDAIRLRAEELEAELVQAKALQAQLNAAEQRVAEQQSATQQLEQDIALLRQTQAQALAEANQAQQLERDALRLQLAELQTQLAAASAAEQRANALAEELAQLQSLQAQRDEQQQRLDAEYQAALTQLRSELEANERASGAQLETVRAELARAGADLQSAQEMHAEQLTVQRDRSAAELAGLQTALADKERELAQQTAQLQAQAEQARQDGAAGIRDLEAQLAESRQTQSAEQGATAEQLAQLREALTTKTQLAEEATVATTELKAQLAEIQQRAQVETAQLLATASALQGELEAAQNAAQAQRTQLEARIKSRQEEADAALTHASQQADVRIAELQSQLTKAEQDAKTEAERQSALQNELQTAQAQREELQTRINTLQNEADAALSKTSEQAETRIAELQAQLSQAEQHAKTETEQQRSAAAALQQELQAAQQAREELQSRIEALQRAADTALSKTREQAEARITELQAQLIKAEQNTQTEVVQLQSASAALQQELQAAQQAREELQSRIETLQKEADAALSKTGEQAEARITELQAQLAQAEQNAQTQVEKLRNTATILQQELQTAQHRQDELQARIKTLQDDAEAALARTSKQAGERLAAELAKVRAELETAEKAAQSEIVSLRTALEQETHARVQDGTRLEGERAEWQVLGKSLEDKLTLAERGCADAEATAKAFEQELERLRVESNAAHQAAHEGTERAEQEVEALRAELKQVGEQLNQALGESDAVEESRVKAENEIVRLKARVLELESAAQSEGAQGGKSEKKHNAALNKLRAELTAAETEAKHHHQELQAQLEQAMEQGRAAEARFAQQQAQAKESGAQLDQARRRAAQLVEDVEDVKRQLEAQTQQRLAAETARKAAQDKVDALRAESQIMSNLGGDHIEASSAQRVRDQQAQIARLESELQETKKNVEVAVRLRAESDSARQAFEQEIARLKEHVNSADGSVQRRVAHGGSGFTLRSVPGMSLAAGWLVALGLGAYLALSGGGTTPSVTQPAPVIASVQPVPAPAPKTKPAPVAAVIVPKHEPAVVARPVTEAPKPTVHALGTFRDALREGGSGPLMTRLPAGSYQMGSAGNSLNFEETPRHDVRLKAFAIGSYEVSFDDYDRYAAATGRGMPSDHGWGRGTRPVININWDEAVAYVRWLSEQTGHHYRLPSEAEWEYAAAAGTSTFYAWGNNGGENHAVCFNCGSRWDARETAPVGSFAANAFGLHDMAGNVLEWVADCRHDSYQNAPGEGEVWAGGDCARHMARGGAYDSPLDNLRTQSRPYFATGTRLNNLGLRVVRED